MSESVTKHECTDPKMGEIALSEPYRKYLLFAVINLTYKKGKVTARVLPYISYNFRQKRKSYKTQHYKASHLNLNYY